ncbi:MAG: hypothetical protein ACHQVK_02760, partial [Candidatus Paceibacterales bacterium]
MAISKRNITLLRLTFILLTLFSFTKVKSQCTGFTLFGQGDPLNCTTLVASATVVPNGGTPPYTYNWQPSGGTGTIANGLSAGVYTIYATDANNCTTSAIVV